MQEITKGCYTEIFDSKELYASCIVSAIVSGRMEKIYQEKEMEGAGKVEVSAI